MAGSILADQDPECWGALDFVDPQNMKPRKRTLIIESHGMDTPPGNREKRVFFRFKGDRRKCYLKKTSRVFMALKLGTLDPDRIVGAALQITAVMARNPKGNPPEVLSMTVIDAAFPKELPKAAEHKPDPQQPAQPPPPNDDPDDFDRSA